MAVPRNDQAGERGVLWPKAFERERHGSGSFPGAENHRPSVRGRGWEIGPQNLPRQRSLDGNVEQMPQEAAGGVEGRGWGLRDVRHG